MLQIPVNIICPHTHYHRFKGLKANRTILNIFSKHINQITRYESVEGRCMTIVHYNQRAEYPPRTTVLFSFSTSMQSSSPVLLLSIPLPWAIRAISSQHMALHTLCTLAPLAMGACVLFTRSLKDPPCPSWGMRHTSTALYFYGASKKSLHKPRNTSRDILFHRSYALNYYLQLLCLQFLSKTHLDF